MYVVSMKKIYVFILFFILFILVITVIGCNIVMGDKLVMVEKDIFNIQSNKEVYFNPYGYSIDNPNVIVNPYGNSPLTAIVMFESSNYSEVSICIKDKDGDCGISYSFDSNKYHIIPIYGLYADYNNVVVISSDGVDKVINIVTDELPDDFGDILYENDYSFYNGNYPYATDSRGNVRWYLTDNYFGNITVYGDNVIIGNDSYIENGNSTGIYRMNFLGKVYSEYLLSNDYYGFNTYYDGYIYAISKDIVVIDIQTGDIVLEYDNDNYECLGVMDGIISFYKDDKWYSYNDSNEIVESEFSLDSNKYSFYDNISEYKIIKGSRFGKLNETKMYDKDISIIKYDMYEDDNINIVMDVSRIVVYNDSDDEVYLILDKLFDKRIYEVDKVRYINLTSLSGKYTIYYKINGKAYKTDYFIEV